MVTRTLDFVWSSYASLHMLAGSPPEKLSKVFSHREIRKQLINCLIVLLLWARTWYWSLSLNSLSTNRSNIWVCLVSLVYWTLKNDHNQSNFVDSVKSLCQQTFKVNSEQMCRHCLSSKCHVSFKMRTSFVTVILPFLKLRKWKRPWEPGWAETQLQLQTQNLNNCSHPISTRGKLQKWNEDPLLLSTFCKGGGVLV